MTAERRKALRTNKWRERALKAEAELVVVRERAERNEKRLTHYATEQFERAERLEQAAKAVLDSVDEKPVEETLAALDALRAVLAEQEKEQPAK